MAVRVEKPTCLDLTVSRPKFSTNLHIVKAMPDLHVRNDSPLHLIKQFPSLSVIHRDLAGIPFFGEMADESIFQYLRSRVRGALG